MPRTDGEGLGPGLERRLRAALDRVDPPYSEPRYAHAPTPASRWTGAPAVFAAAVTGLLIITLLAAASARGLDLQHRVVNTIQSATEASPTPAVVNPSPSPAPVVPQQAPEESPNATPSAEPTGSPEPGDDHSGSTSGASASPSPEE